MTRAITLGPRPPESPRAGTGGVALLAAGLLGLLAVAWRKRKYRATAALEPQFLFPNKREGQRQTNLVEAAEDSVRVGSEVAAAIGLPLVVVARGSGPGRRFTGRTGPRVVFPHGSKRFFVYYQFVATFT